MGSFETECGCSCIWSLLWRLCCELSICCCRPCKQSGAHCCMSSLHTAALLIQTTDGFSQSCMLVNRTAKGTARLQAWHSGSLPSTKTHTLFVSLFLYLESGSQQNLLIPDWLNPQGLHRRADSHQSGRKASMWEGDAPHGVCSFGAHGQHRGGRPPAACVPAQHLVLRQLDQILQPLLIYLRQDMAE